ncbi:MAG: AMP-binding protein [Polyangiaceae bacterium]
MAHLGQLARQRADVTALVVVSERDGQLHEVSLGYAELERKVRALASRLQRFARGERALLLLENDEHYVISFFACLYAGLVAVPVFPPESLRPQHMARLLGIARDARPGCVLTTRELEDALSATLAESFDASVVSVDVVADSSAEGFTPSLPNGDDVAFLQYTSGSTSSPKGVMVTHDNLMANSRAIEEGLGVKPEDVFVSWLPLFHDMGLVGGLLQPIHRGIKLVLMSPRFFIERPQRWLEAIARHRGTIAGAPNFAYRMLLERVTDAQLEGLESVELARCFLRL